MLRTILFCYSCSFYGWIALNLYRSANSFQGFGKSSLYVHTNWVKSDQKVFEQIIVSIVRKTVQI